jgi:hypothetical protein
MRESDLLRPSVPMMGVVKLFEGFDDVMVASTEIVGW